MSEHPLRVRPCAKTKTVTLVFDPPAVLFPMTPAQALALAEMLTKRALELEPRKIMKGKRIPHDWELDADLLAWTKRERPDVDVKLAVESFRDYWEGKAGRDALKLDWAATWRNWVRRMPKGEMPKQQPPAVEVFTNSKLCVKCQGTGWDTTDPRGAKRCGVHEISEPCAPPDETVVQMQDYLSGKKASMK